MNFGIDEDTRTPLFLTCFLDLKFALRATQNWANFKSSTLVTLPEPHVGVLEEVDEPLCKGIEDDCGDELPGDGDQPR